uniref:Type IV pilus twitching motility protein PilT n=1 Tax=candidate division WOR-3 bacterium TaxID=2052148 RepID=A0A7C4U7S3_UNCW3
MVKLGELLKLMVTKNASDLILKVGSKPVFRIYGELFRIEDHPVVEAEDTMNVAKNILTEEQFQNFIATNESDVAVNVPNLSRFRINFMRQRRTVAIVFRRIPQEIPKLEDGYPPILKDFAMRPRGLVLVTGPSGCGKSTTIAAMVEYRNKREPCHIITIEDPIEFVFKNDKASIDQREVGRDTRAFANALKYSLRQDPDVIVVGEMRDLETISLAITAAETGHLVLSSLHTNNAVETIDRVIDVFPPFQQRQIRLQMSSNLVGVVSQILLKKKDGSGVIPAFEIMVSIAAVRKLIREAKTHQIPSVMQTRTKEGMKTMNMSLLELVTKGVITLADALNVSPEPEELEEMFNKVEKVKEV